VVNNLPIGRNFDEMLRVIDALQFTEEYSVPDGKRVKGA
jgi:peroxiredoxin (alkyl hydroperoxide reductase subunit C)